MSDVELIQHSVLTYDDWRIDLVAMNGQPMLRIMEGERRIAYCADKRTALEVLAGHAVPLAKFSRRP